MKNAEIQATSRLRVEFVNAMDEDGVLICSDTWAVTVLLDCEHCVLLFGFGRKLDAEIAKDALDQMELDFGNSRSGFWRRMEAAGYAKRKDLMRAACERLEW